jgi:flagellar hook-associated protein 3 FlgL
MRVATAQYQAMMNQSLQKNQARITELTEQMANGNRIQLPSDDPVDSVRLSRLKREEASIDQYRANIAAVKQRMSKNEGYLTNMVNDMNSGRDLLVWASDGSNAPDDLNAMVTSLTALRDSLMYTANSVDQEGRTSSPAPPPTPSRSPTTPAQRWVRATPMPATATTRPWWSATASPRPPTRT